MFIRRKGSRTRGRLVPRAVRLQQDAAVGHHVTMRLVDDRALATNAAGRRLAARAISRVADAFGLLAFGIADTHLHVLLAADRLRAGECARRIEISLQQQLGLRVRFQPARVRPVESQSHLQRAFMYVLRQLDHHRLDVDGAHDGTSLPDLLGLRISSSNLRARVMAMLPRVDLPSLGKVLELTTMSPAQLDRELLPEAAAAAFGLADLRKPGRTVTRAIIAAVHVGEHLSASELGRLLGPTPSCIRRLRKQRPEPHELRAVRLQLSLRASVAARARTAHERAAAQLAGAPSSSEPIE